MNLKMLFLWKKVKQDLNIFRIDLRVRQKVSDKIKTSIYFIYDDLKNVLKIIYLVENKSKIYFDWMRMG